MPFNLARPLVIVRTARSSSYLQYRTAQTARQPQDDPESSHEASTSASASSSSRQIPDRKGKGRADPAVEGYRFPERGRNGGAPDPFEVLALERSASQAQVKQQYYRLALILHPDSTHPSSSPAHFATLNRAYTLLSSPSSRNDYLTFGQGWGSSEGTYYDPAYAAMRAEVMRRGRARASRGGRAASAESQPGWDGGYGVDGEWYKYPNRSEQEPRYMSHRRFVGFILAGSAIIGWAQYIRVEQVNENRRMVLDASHMDASHALAAAREEARANGRARREQIRRKVNESKYLREIDKVEQEGGGTT